ncbi:MAG: sulfatase-like hydrolase/transferase [Cellvibrionaceae bacterium]
MSHGLIIKTLVIACFAICVKATATQASNAPNIIVVHTSQSLPQALMTQLGSQGATLSRYASPPVLSADRAALITGRNPIRLGIAYNNIQAWDNAGIHSDETTVAELLQTAGYQTAFWGNWGLGHAQEIYHPRAKGFDDFIGQLMIDADTLPPYRANGAIDLQRNGVALAFDGHINQLVLDRLTSLLSKPLGKAPFFVFLSLSNSTSLGATTATEAIKLVGKFLSTSPSAKNTLVVISNRPAANTEDNNRFLAAQNAMGNAVLIWPNRILQGTVIETLTSPMDILPTLVSATELKYKPRKKLDGMDLWPQLRGDKTAKPSVIDRTIILVHESQYGTVKALQLHNNASRTNGELTAFSQTSHYRYTSLSIESRLCRLEGPSCIQIDNRTLAKDAKKTIRTQRSLHPINGIRHSDQAPAGWRAPQYWHRHTIPRRKLNPAAAPGDVPRIARTPLDYQLGDKGRIIYDCEPTWWLFNLCF